MNVIIDKSTARGCINAPPSKSIAHRALICGALSGSSVIHNIAYSKDIEATLNCLIKLGASVEKNDDTIKIGGLDLHKIKEGINIFCNESGSTLRFLIPLCMLCDKKVELSGSERLFERPLSIYEEIAEKQGLLFKKTCSSLVVKGKLQPAEYSVRGDVSSQFISGLLFALPLLESDSIINIVGNFESASYIDLTVDVLKNFGVEVERKNNSFYIKGNQKYSSNNYTVEGDCSNSAFLEAFNYIGGNVEVQGIKKNTLQGDRVYSDIFYGLKNGKKSFDLSDCPDLAPVVFSLSAYYGGAEFTGTKRLRIKESDRATAMAEELAKFGINASVFDNSVVIEKGVINTPTEVLDGHNDHRIVMALSLLCSKTGGEIKGADAVEKSYPDFFEKIAGLGIKVSEIYE